MKNFDLFPSCKIEKVQLEKKTLSITLSSQTTATCPYCQAASSRKNGHYTRSAHDLPLAENCVRLNLRVQRYLCLNESCSYKTFGEQVPVVGRYAQRSRRLLKAHSKIAIQLGGEAGTALATQLNMPISADTLLRDINLQALPTIETPRVPGVDDWAMKKREQKPLARGSTLIAECWPFIDATSGSRLFYGTILVDLERHKVVDLLDGRDSKGLAQWLKTHPGIKIISRDRSRDYAKAAKEAAPDAEQVVDRWHLLQNLGQMLERWPRSIQKQLINLPLSTDMYLKMARLFPAKPSLSRATKAAQASAKASLKRKSELHKQVKDLYKSAMKQVHISEKMGIHRHTVRAYIQADEAPNHQWHARPASILDPHLHYLEKRLAEGCENASQLWREIVEPGYPGKPWQVYMWLQPKRSKPSKNGSKTARKNKRKDSRSFTINFLPSAPQLAWLFMKDTTELDEKECLIFEYLFQDDQLKTMYNRIHKFKRMLLKKEADLFDAWLDESQNSDITILQPFIHGLRLDYDAVKAAITSVWSNGQVEGQVNKLKLLKRQMCRRASFDLLRKRVLLA